VQNIDAVRERKREKERERERGGTDRCSQREREIYDMVF
jgi:hypothetical protein